MYHYFDLLDKISKRFKSVENAGALCLFVLNWSKCTDVRNLETKLGRQIELISIQKKSIIQNRHNKRTINNLIWNFIRHNLYSIENPANGKFLPASWIITAVSTNRASQIWKRLILTNRYQNVKSLSIRSNVSVRFVKLFPNKLINFQASKIKGKFLLRCQASHSFLSERNSFRSSANPSELH